MHRAIERSRLHREAGEGGPFGAFDDAWLYHEVDLPLGERSLPATQLMRDEALAVFRAWGAKSDKVRY